MGPTLSILPYLSNSILRDIKVHKNPYKSILKSNERKEPTSAPQRMSFLFLGNMLIFPRNDPRVRVRSVARGTLEQLARRRTPRLRSRAMLEEVMELME